MYTCVPGNGIELLDTVKAEVPIRWTVSGTQECLLICVPNGPSVHILAADKCFRTKMACNYEQSTEIELNTCHSSSN